MTAYSTSGPTPLFLLGARTLKKNIKTLSYKIKTLFSMHPICKTFLTIPLTVFMAQLFAISLVLAESSQMFR